MFWEERFVKIKSGVIELGLSLRSAATGQMQLLSHIVISGSEVVRIRSPLPNGARAEMPLRARFTGNHELV